MKKISALLVAVLMGMVAVRYSYLMYLGEVKPILATWLLFSLATAIGIWTYFKSDDIKRDAITNSANTVDVVVTWSILISLLFLGKETRYIFTLFEFLCIGTSIAILLYWKISQKAKMANFAINVLLVIGYFPTIVSLYNSTTNTESFSVWIMVLTSQVIALYNPIKERDWLALLYALRAVMLVSVVLGLMIRIELS
ncbi:hypothetical protein ACFL16_00155 [Patescibacteria group bacterium]